MAPGIDQGGKGRRLAVNVPVVHPRRLKVINVPQHGIRQAHEHEGVTLSAAERASQLVEGEGHGGMVAGEQNEDTSEA